MNGAIGPSRRRLTGVRRHAFTFIEILATMALLSIVLPAVMNGISLCLSTADFASRQAKASSLGYSKLMELVALEQWQQANLSGDFRPEQPDYRWTAQVSDWDGTLRQMDVTVLWRQAGQQRSVELSTLVDTGGST